MDSKTTSVDVDGDFLEPLQCLGCSSRRIRLEEVVSGKSIASKWIEEWRLQELDIDFAAALEHFWPGSAPVVEVRVYRCLECGLETCLPSRTWSDAEYPAFEHYPEERWEYREFLGDLPAGGLRILELGCGDGHFLKLASMHRHRPIGVDFSAKAVANSQSRGLNAIRGGFEELRSGLKESGDAAEFDAVALFHVIEHLHDPHSVFDLLADVSQPGAYLGLSCPSPRRFTRLISESRVSKNEFWDYPPYHVLHWTLPALTRFLEGHGWVVRRTLEEPFTVVGAAATVGVSRARWRGLSESSFWTKYFILESRLRLRFRLKGYSGISQYVFAQRPLR